MSARVVTAKGTEATGDIPLGTSSMDSAGSIEPPLPWSHRSLNALAILIIAAGFLLRLAFASRSFLNPDEALLYLFSDQPTLWQAYKASLGTAHPPLLIVFLYFWKLLGRSELMLRLPSVLAGAGFCWFTFRWMEKCFSKVAGLIALVLVAFSPSLIGISIELRQYSLLLLFMAAALYYLEAALQQGSARAMWIFHCFLFLAILIQYSAVFFVVAAGCYALVRIAEGGAPRRVILSWVAGQCAAAGIYAALFVTHLWTARSQISLWSGGYNLFFFRGDFADIFTFLRENTPSLFEYFFGEKYLAQTLLVLWMAGLAALLLGGLLRGWNYPRSNPLGLLLLLPFLAIWGAVATGNYPYSPGRHTVILEPFAIAALSALLAALVRQKLWRGLALAVVLSVISSASGYTAGAFPITGDQRRDLMTAAVRYVQQSIPAGEPILLDNQSSMVADFYLCAPGEAGPFYLSESELNPFFCGRHSFVALNYRSWVLTDKNLPARFRLLVEQRNLRPGSRVWLVQFSWRADLDADLRDNLPSFRCLASARFGKHIVIFPVQVGPERSAQPVTDCGN